MFSFIIALVGALFALASSAEPTLGVQFSSSASGLPTLTLPYGTWVASEYDSVDDVRTPMIASFMIGSCNSLAKMLN